MFKFNLSFSFIVILLFLFTGCSDEILEDSVVVGCGSIISDSQIFEDSLSLQLNPAQWNDKYYLDWDNGFVGGNYGQLSKTTDGGNTWSSINTQTDHHINSIHFLDDQIGFLGGKKQWDGNGSIFLSTIDGGLSWNTVTFKDTVGVDNIHFYDRFNGIARVRYSDSYLRYALSLTKDGGLNWSKLDIPYLRALVPIEITESRIYVFCEDNKLYMSADKGNNWINVELPNEFSNGISKMHFVNDMFGFIAKNDVVFRTDNGGLLWQETSLNISELDGVNFSLQGLHFFNDNEGFIIHHVCEYEDIPGVIVEFPTYQGMKILETSDSGYNWTQSELIEDCTLSQDLQVFDRKNLLSLGYGLNYQIRKN